MQHEKLGRYRIVSELGRGAMGAVYRAVDPLIEREVAIKTLLPELPPEIVEEVRERFLREARSAGRLNHPNIVTIFDVGEDAGVAYIAMELLEGRSLQQMLRAQPRLPLANAADIAAQVADALDHAQEYRIVHRDIKPANVMVAASGRCKLTDFGIAYIPTSSMTQTGATLGSPKYMSPEQVIGIAVDGRADVFSLGVVLYEMLTGRNPFVREGDTTPVQVMHRISVESAAPMRTHDPAIPESFDRIMRRALAKKPQERFARAAEMADELRRAAREASAADTAYEKTVKVNSIRDPLLDDIDTFAKRFDEAQEAQQRAAEAERKRQEQERLQRAAEKARKRAAEQQQVAAQAVTQAAGHRPSALDAVRKQAETKTAAPPREDPAAARARALAVLDQEMRAAYQYLAQFVGEVNSVNPNASGPYDFLYIGRLPVSLAEAFVDHRLRSVGGREYYSRVFLRYRVNPEPPARATIFGADVVSCDQLLKTFGADYAMQVEARTDFGEPRRAIFTVNGKLPCELKLEPDYEALTVSVELVNVRRPGKRKSYIPAERFKDVGDTLARYILGADNDFERLLT